MIVVGLGGLRNIAGSALWRVHVLNQGFEAGDHVRVALEEERLGFTDLVVTVPLTSHFVIPIIQLFLDLRRDIA